MTPDHPRAMTFPKNDLRRCKQHNEAPQQHAATHTYRCRAQWKKPTLHLSKTFSCVASLPTKNARYITPFLSDARSSRSVVITDATDANEAATNFSIPVLAKSACLLHLLQQRTEHHKSPHAGIELLDQHRRSMRGEMSKKCDTRPASKNLRPRR